LRPSLGVAVEVQPDLAETTLPVLVDAEAE
jgi:hypothetical protein